MKIVVTGGCGYKGSVLVPQLLASGHEVQVVDLLWFGNHLPQHANLSVINKDVRYIQASDLKPFEAVVHLAAVANDPCSELDPKLSWEINVLGTMNMIEIALQKGARQFIHASSGSVYGIKDEEKVTEDLDLKPISEYNKTKMVAERLLLSYKEKIALQIIRPATVCGVSPRMRLDVSVNLLTTQALTKKEITILGGDQVRPNIHIEDIARVYQFFLENSEICGIYNAGFENMSIKQIAHEITQDVPANIVRKPSNDPRSYRICSDKLLATGFLPKKKVSDAIHEIKSAFIEGKFVDDSRSYNIRWMQSHSLFNPNQHSNLMGASV